MGCQGKLGLFGLLNLKEGKTVASSSVADRGIRNGKSHNPKTGFYFLDLRIGDLVNHGPGINLHDSQQRQTLFLSYFFLRVEWVGTHNPGYFFTTNI